jgi:hypothetical protein
MTCPGSQLPWPAQLVVRKAGEQAEGDRRQLLGAGPSGASGLPQHTASYQRQRCQWAATPPVQSPTAGLTLCHRQC